MLCQCSRHFFHSKAELQMISRWTWSIHNPYGIDIVSSVHKVPIYTSSHGKDRKAKTDHLMIDQCKIATYAYLCRMSKRSRRRLRPTNHDLFNVQTIVTYILAIPWTTGRKARDLSSRELSWTLLKTPRCSVVARLLEIQNIIIP